MPTICEALNTNARYLNIKSVNLSSNNLIYTVQPTDDVIIVTTTVNDNTDKIILPLATNSTHCNSGRTLTIKNISTNFGFDVNINVGEVGTVINRIAQNLTFTSLAPNNSITLVFKKGSPNVWEVISSLS